MILPSTLTSHANFVTWKYMVRDGKETKVPFDAKNPKRMAKPNDSATWATFEQALKVASDPLSGFDGVGFMLQGTNLVGVDFDGVIDEAGTVDPYALSIIALLGNPYTEITPSGSGLRCFVESDKLPAGKNRFDGGGEHHGIEIYIGTGGARYLTVTGNKYGGEGIPCIKDLELPYFLISQFGNAKLKQLWTGDTSRYKDNQSSADLALCDELVKLLGKDPMKVDRYFRASALMREKWDEIHNGKDTYGFMTINLALGVKSTNADTSPMSSNADKKQKIELEPPKAQFSTGDAIVLKRVNWFWKDRVPLGKITLFAGNPDNGKSLVSTWVAATATKGRDFPDCKNHTPASEVLMLVGEDDIEDTVAPRLKVADADLSKIHFMNSMRWDSGEERDIQLDKDMKAVEEKLIACPNIRVIIIDPISNYLGDVSMVAEQEARSILIPLKRIAAEKNVAVIIVMHLNKKNELEAISRVGGAMAFIGVARASWLFVRDADEEEEEGEPAKEKKDTFSMLRIKNNLVERSKNGWSYEIKAKKLDELNLPGTPEENWTPYVVWGSSVAQSADDALGKHGDRKRGRPAGLVTDKQSRATSWLQDFLQNGPKTAKDIEAAGKVAGHSVDMLRDVFKAMGGEIFRTEKTEKTSAQSWWKLTHMNETRETKSDDCPTEVPPDQSVLYVDEGGCHRGN